MTPGKTQWTDNAMRRLLAMKREGLSNTTIALRLGCSRSTVRKKLQEIEQLDRKKPERTNRPQTNGGNT
jgi:DNA invertase Pin-like site-specific DNA recombinase